MHLRCRQILIQRASKARNRTVRYPRRDRRTSPNRDNYFAAFATEVPRVSKNLAAPTNMELGDFDAIYDRSAGTTLDEYTSSSYIVI
jgi:hypothetical protein